ncbi:MAG: HAD family phosphatase [Actinobacteria bacterium]|nr:MAG: HAD family phosphatase [Actinomycetota bacterium]
MRPAALLLDFNGTLSDDEHIQYEIYREIFAEAGKPLAEAEYFEQLAGLSDPEIVRTWFGEARPELVAERVRRYRTRAANGSTVGPEKREAVRYAAKRAQLAIVSVAARVEIESVLRAAGLAALVSLVISVEDVATGKPDPAGYTLALRHLKRRPDEAVVIEDSEAGVAAAKAAGLYCIALEGTMAIDRLGRADEVVGALDVELMRRVLG